MQRVIIITKRNGHRSVNNITYWLLESHHDYHNDSHNDKERYLIQIWNSEANEKTDGKTLSNYFSPLTVYFTISLTKNQTFYDQSPFISLTQSLFLSLTLLNLQYLQLLIYWAGDIRIIVAVGVGYNNSLHHLFLCHKSIWTQLFENQVS